MLTEDQLKMIREKQASKQVVVTPKKPQPRTKPKDDELVVDQATLDDALQMVANFKPKRRRDPMPVYPDLSVEGEKRMRGKPGGANYWLMPFRRKDFIEHCCTARYKKKISSTMVRSCNSQSKM